MPLSINRNFVLITAGAVLWGIGEGMYLYYHTLYLQQMGASTVFIGSLFSLVGVFQMLVQAPAGRLADRFGRLPLLRAGWLTAVMSTWIFALASNLALFSVGLVVNGLMAVGWPAQYNYISSIPSRMSRGRALTAVLAFAFGGTALGSLLGGLISAALGLRSLYAVAAAFTTASLVFIFSLQPQSVVRAGGAQARAALSHNRPYLLFLGVLLVVSVGMMVPYLFGPNYLKDVAGLSLQQVGTLGAVAGAGNVVILLLLGSLPPYSAFLIGQALIVVFSLLMLRGGGVAWFGVAYFCLGGIWLVKSIAAVIARNLVEERISSFAIGLEETVQACGGIVAPFLAGLLYRNSPGSVLVFGSWTLLLGMLLSLALAWNAQRHPFQPVENEDR